MRAPAAVRFAVVLAMALVLAGCVSKSIKSTSVPSVNGASVEVEETLLLDVGIAVFDPGIDDYDEGDDERIYPEVRKAEARYMPGILAEAMQNSGAWGAIRVVPDSQQITDLIVEGKILYSDGEELQLQIVATDSRGYVWLDKAYTGNASGYAYKMTARSRFDPFQAVYNTIANDLLQRQEELRAEDRENIRTVTELLFARSFSADAFDGYLGRNRQDHYVVLRLRGQQDS